MFVNQSTLVISLIFMTSLFFTIYYKFTSNLNVSNFKENVVYVTLNGFSATAFMLYGCAVMNFIRIYHFEKTIPTILVCYYAVVSIIITVQFLMFCFFTIEASALMQSKIKHEFGLETEMFISKKKWYNRIIKEEVEALRRIRKGA